MYKLNRQQIISIVLLFALLLSLFLGKKENFTETERKSALDGLTTQNKLFNSVFSKISNNEVDVNKKIIAKKGIISNENIETKNKDIKNGKITIGANGTIYTERLNVKNEIEAVKNIKYSRNTHDGSSWTTVYNGIWGDWKEQKSCPNGQYVCGMQVRFENKQGKGDDTALNGIKMKCCKF